MDTPAPRSAIDGCAASQQALDATLDALTDEVVARPSLLLGWSVGHVLTHLARNADGLLRMVEGAARDEIAEMYPGGFAAREADIEAGAGRSAGALAADVRASGERLLAAFDAASPSVWAGSGSTLRGPLRLVDVPERRRGEVEIHRVDLALGCAFADWPAPYLRTELARMTGVWASRKPMGFSDLPAVALALTPPDRLAWLLGRLDVPGLGDAGVF